MKVTELSTKFVSTVLTACASLLLVACSENDNQLHSADGVWSAPAYGKVFELKRSGNGYTSTLFHVPDSSCLQAKPESNLTAEDLAQITQLKNKDEIEIRRGGEVLAPGVDYTRLTQLPELCTDARRVAVKGDLG